MNSIAISPDSNFIAVPVDRYKNHNIKIYTQNGEHIRTIQGHSRVVGCVAFSPYGQYIASCSRDKTVKLWRVETGECTRTMSDWVNGVAFSPDGQYIASGSLDTTVKLWLVETGACLKTLEEHSGSVVSVAFSPDGQYLASGSDDKTVKLWRVENGECTRTMEGHSDWVQCVAFSPDGQYLASGSDDETVKLWSTPKAVRTQDRIKRLMLMQRVKSKNANLLLPEIVKKIVQTDDITEEEIGAGIKLIRTIDLNQATGQSTATATQVYPKLTLRF